MKAVALVLGLCILLAGCVASYPTAHPVYNSPVGHYGRYGPYDYREHQNLAHFHRWIEDRTRVYRDPGKRGHHSHGGACYRCH